MKKILAIGFLIFEAYIVISFSHSVWDLYSKQGEIKHTEDRVDSLARENNKLKSELNYVRTDAYVEKTAREKLNLVREGETIVVIPDSVLKAATASSQPTPIPPNWEQWMRLFF